MVLRPEKIKAAWAALPVELVVGTIMFAHGLGKLMDPAAFAANALGGIPMFLAFLVIAAEVGGGLLLLTGLFVRLGAFGHLCVMAVAVAEVHWATGLMGRGGFEFPLALLAASIALLIIGPDPLSIDRNIGLSIFRPRDGSFLRENTYAPSAAAKAAGAMLIVAGLVLVLAAASAALTANVWNEPPRFVAETANLYLALGLPSNLTSAVITIIAGLASATSGAALIAGKLWAYIPAFVMARLYLAASTLLLFWVKYTVRGLVAVTISFAMLVGLHSARRGH